MNITPPLHRPVRQLVLLLVIILPFVCWLLFGRAPQMPRAQAQVQATDYKNFEAPQVHPLAITPDGTRLLALDTPEQRLEVFNLGTGTTPVFAFEVRVGAEPVSVVARNNTEAWVVNWLSDSVSVVDLTSGRVTRTIDVGDEPTDVVFAGQQKELAFVCVSGLSQIKVFDPNAPAAAPQVITVRGKQPRALARSNDGAQVFVSVFESGNQTTIISETQVAQGGGAPPPTPALRAGLPPPPRTGLILKWNGTRWADETGDTRWHNFVPYTLADVDIVALDARGASVSTREEIRGVGTNIGNGVFDADGNRLYVVNFEARNQVRFEPNIRGRFLQQRISIIGFHPGQTSGGPAVDLNPSINLSNAAGTDTERAKALSLPADIVRAADGTLYVAATGSNKVGVLNAAGSVRQRIDVGQGPTGLALDEARGHLYVLNRFDESVSVVDTAARAELLRVPLGFNPEPAQVRDGRRFLYNGTLSAHGDLSCASCHFNGHRDGLAWDLGDPQGQLQQFGFTTFHPMKGPMTTQSLRGIINASFSLSTEPLHWRGDRARFDDFNPAFVSLLGAPRQLNTTEFAAFTALVRTLTYPPNPNQNLDRTLPNPATGPNATRGRQTFLSLPSDGGVLNCNACHAILTNGIGTDRNIIPSVALGESQDFKVPQLRGLYQKTGLQRAPGEQLAGYGFAHDGNFDSLVSFLHAPVFTFQNDNQRRDIEAFMLAFDTGLAPAVGLQVTVNATNKTDAAVRARVQLLQAQADAHNCDLIVTDLAVGGTRGAWLYTGNDTLTPNRSGVANVQGLLGVVDNVSAGAEITFTGVPVGAGRRLSIDRDGDGTLDGDEQTESLTVSGRVTTVSQTPVGGVTITLVGPQTFTAQTGADGRYSIANIPAADYTVTPTKPGTPFPPSLWRTGSVRGELIFNFVLPSQLQFSAATYTSGEDASQALINVTRTGDTSTAASVQFATVDNNADVGCADVTTMPNVAFARCDYATTIDTINFAAGEASKTISIPLIADAHVEGNEAVTLRLSDATGATLGQQTTATLVITDGNAQATNPVFGNAFFVRQQYLDFLSREPDQSGFDAWLRVLNGCPDVNNVDPNSPSAGCDRIIVSQSFFGSQEFQLKGYFVYRFYEVALRRRPLYDEVIPDMRGVSGQTAAEVFAKRAAFADAFYERPEVTALFPNTISDAQFVSTLLAPYQTNVINTPDPANPDGTQFVTLTQSDMAARLAAGTLTRAQVLRAIVESREVDVREFNGAFVAMQYYGYLRRTPEEAGFNAWLGVLQRGESFRTMVNGFMNSTEYRLRFGQT